MTTTDERVERVYTCMFVRWDIIREILERYFDEKNDCFRLKFGQLIYNMKCEESIMLKIERFKKNFYFQNFFPRFLFQII